MSERILLINPNSNEAVTTGMAEAVKPLVLPGGPVFECVTLQEGPFGIESVADAHSVMLPLRDMVRVRTDAAAFAIACFSDPGLTVCREATTRPVLGIREAAVSTALSLGDLFGVVALAAGSAKRQAVAFRAMGVASRWAGSEPLNLSVAAGEEPSAYPRVRHCAEALVERGADVIILGCAGMARHRASLEAELGRPVIDPTQAAAVHAMGLVLLNRARSTAAHAA